MSPNKRQVFYWLSLKLLAYMPTLIVPKAVRGGAGNFFDE
jgi:hypothetical protein